jgi:hypothetical protein
MGVYKKIMLRRQIGNQSADFWGAGAIFFHPFDMELKILLPSDGNQLCNELLLASCQSALS